MTFLIIVFGATVHNGILWQISHCRVKYFFKNLAILICLLNTFWKWTLFLENGCFLFSGVQRNPPQGLSIPDSDSQLRADGSGAANPVSGVVPPECCRLLHLLTLLLTLWGECSHICLCVWCDSASGSDNLFHSNNHCSLDEYLQRLYSIQISLALRYTEGCYIKSVCAMLSFTMQAALKNHKMPHHYVYWIAVCLSSHKDIYAQK